MAGPVTVAVMRTVKEGQESAFEEALHAFVERSLSQTGQMGVHIIRPARGSLSRQYGIVRKFSSHETLVAYRESAEYRSRVQIAEAMTEGPVKVEELNGLESWFTPQGSLLRPLPKWKMAMITFGCVYTITAILTWTIVPPMRGWPFLVRNAAYNVMVVSSLTWGAMPIMTRVFYRWLHGQAR